MISDMYSVFTLVLIHMIQTLI